MIVIKKEGVVLSKTLRKFENEGVLNPGTIREGEYVHMFYRAVSTGNQSSIGYCKLKGPLLIEDRMETALLSPLEPYESQGMEDPRIVKIDEFYYLTYTAYDGINALGALAISTDLKTFTRIGIIVPQVSFEEFNRLVVAKEILADKSVHCHEHDRLIKINKKEVLVWDKNLIFFPRRINGNLHFIHRIKPDIQIVGAVECVKELTPAFWEKYLLNLNSFIVMSPLYDHESSYVGGGCPPLETAHGWLFIYHGVCTNEKGYVYSACAALLDLENPQKEIARLPYALFKPEYPWELKGEVNNVCFPTGTALFDDTLYIYYGAADERIGVASVSLTDLLDELLKNLIPHDQQFKS